MCRNDIQLDLLTYVREQAYEDVQPDSDLLESGYVDSLLVMDLVLFIKSRFQVSLGASDLAPRNFRSIDRLADLVISKAPASSV